MTIHIHLTHRLAELFGYRERSIELPEGADLEAALSEVERSLVEPAPAGLLQEGRLHSSILVVVGGEAALRGHPRPLQDGTRVQLMLPVAGG